MKRRPRCLPNSTSETLISARIVVLQSDLQLDGLEKLSLLGLLRVLEQTCNWLVQWLSRNFTLIVNKRNRLLISLILYYINTYRIDLYITSFWLMSFYRIWTKFFFSKVIYLVQNNFTLMHIIYRGLVLELEVWKYIRLGL